MSFNNLLLRTLRKLKLLDSLNLTLKTNLNSKTFAIPVLRGMGAGNVEEYESWMIQVIDRIRSIRKGSFIDIGTNIGQTLLRLKSVDAEAEYVGFEPNPDCVSYMEELIRKNRFTDATIIPVGVSNKTEILKLNFYDESLTDSSASLNENYRPGKKITHRKAVQVVDYAVIKDVLQGDVGIIKIDVEGFESQVLSGIEPLIREKRPVILLEILPVYEKALHHRLESQEAIEELFRTNRYKILRIKKDSLGKFNYFLPLSGPIGIHSEISDCDYLIIPEEMNEDFAKSIRLNDINA